MSAAKPIICLMGPTASGKTDLAVQLVEALPLEIISVDSVMIYRQMDIGSAKPDAQILARAPHRLIDFLDPAQAYSAANFRDDALREIADIHQQGRIPLLVGGTMMYFHALLNGLAELPSADAAIRQALEDEARQHGWQALHQQLQQVDPLSAQKIHPNDPQRIQRALEVYRITGKPLSSWQQQQVQPLRYPALRIGIVPADRAVLHARIARRFELMLETGLLEEVQALYARGDLHSDMPSIRAVGYRQVWQYLTGEYDWQQMRERGIIATRQLAKRQMTWLRQMSEVQFFDVESKDLLAQTLKLIRQEHIK